MKVKNFSIAILLWFACISISKAQSQPFSCSGTGTTSGDYSCVMGGGLDDPAQDDEYSVYVPYNVTLYYHFYTNIYGFGYPPYGSWASAILSGPGLGTLSADSYYYPGPPVNEVDSQNIYSSVVTTSGDDWDIAEGVYDGYAFLEIHW